MSQEPEASYIPSLEEALTEEQPFQLFMSEADAEAFFLACENPPAPTPAMIEMMKDVMKWME